MASIASMINSSETFLSLLQPDLRDVDRTIHPDDSMFRYTLGTHCGYGDAALFDYFRSGLLAHQATLQLLRWRFGSDLDGLESLLDFGSGYGRVTRFLTRSIPAERIWVAEVDPAGVAFQRDRFGVHGIAGTIDPDRFEPAARFDAIIAYSVLSHLPERVFRSWLHRWLDLLVDDGLLIFSVLGESTLPEGVSLPTDGFRFERWSESSVLSLEDYGVARVSEPYVLRAVEDAAGSQIRVHRIARGLWHLQDLYVLVKGNDPDPTTLAFRRGPVGHLDSCRVDPSRQELLLRGWAVDADAPHQPPSIVVHLDGERIAETEPRDPWPGVSRLHGPVPSAWSVRHDLSRSPASAAGLLRVEALSRTGPESYPIHIGEVDATMLLLDLQRASARAENLQSQVEIFEASGFGRLRQRWMSWKRTLSLGKR